jgi:hypothetical protein
MLWGEEGREGIFSTVYHVFSGPDKKTPSFLIVNRNPPANPISVVGSDLQSADPTELQHERVLYLGSVGLPL